jgi:hypothetical protein
VTRDAFEVKGVPLAFVVAIIRSLPVDVPR